MPNVTPGSVAAFADAAPVPAGAAPGFLARAAGRLRGDPAGVLAAGFLLVVVAAALLAPWISPYDPARQFDIVALRSQPPSAAHWFGTDPFSRDVFSRVLHGARLSLFIAAGAIVLASLLGTAWGAVAGYVGGIVDTLMMRFVDACLSIPRILLLLSIVALWGSFSVLALVALLAVTGWFGASRLVRAEVMAARERDFVAAARAGGAPPWRVLVRHVVPQCLTPVVVAAALGVGHLVVAEAGLAFLGFGIPQPQASWGSIFRDGKDVIVTGWWLSLFPGLALAGTVLAVNIIADRLRAALNPRQLHAP